MICYINIQFQYLNLDDTNISLPTLQWVVLILSLTIQSVTLTFAGRTHERDSGSVASQPPLDINWPFEIHSVKREMVKESKSIVSFSRFFLQSMANYHPQTEYETHSNDGKRWPICE